VPVADCAYRVAMTPRLFALAAAAVAFATISVGLLVGLTPVRAFGVECGSALSPQASDAHEADLFDSMTGDERGGTLGGVAGGCSEQIDTRRPLAISLLFVGGAAVLAAFLGWRQAQRQTQLRPGHGPSGAGSQERRNMDTPR
jgi:hypothetical protein